MGFIPKDAINIMGTLFNLLFLFKAIRVHIKCHVIMCLRIVTVKACVVIDCSSVVMSR